jgi:cytochrome c peroxidase
VSLSEAVLSGLAETSTRIVAVTQRHDVRELNRMVSTEPNTAALGRFIVTLNPADIGAFRTPSLRNVTMTAPYMHDGSVPTLAAAIDLELYEREESVRRPLILSSSDKADLLAFVLRLTSSDNAALEVMVRAASLAVSPKTK